MKLKLFFFKTFELFLIILFFMSCNNPQNNFLKQWNGPYGGTPDFNQINISELEQAIEIGIELHYKEIEKITSNNNSPNFKNTIEAYELSGSDIDRVITYYGVLSNNISSPELRKIEPIINLKLSKYYNTILQNEKLFEKIKFIFNNSAELKLDNKQIRLVELIFQNFLMSGIELNKSEKKRYAEINNKLSALYTKFSNNVLHDEEYYTTSLANSDVSGLPLEYLNSIKSKDSIGNLIYEIKNTRSSIDPFLKFSNERHLRKIVWENFYSRGDNNDDYDNKETIIEILKLRKERVSILGYSDYGSWRLQNRMAKTPENALKLLEDIWPHAISMVKNEVKDMQEIANTDNIIIEPWDYRYYSEKVRQKKFSIQSEEIKQYLQLDKLQEAMFYVAEKIFKYSFIPAKKNEFSVFHNDVKVWKVYNINSEKLIGLWYLDPFARDGKRSGAWATTYRSYSKLHDKKIVLVSNNSNFIKPKESNKILISWDDATTFFHEFGHALNSLASNVEYPTLNSGVRDYTEFQSQLLEKWLYTDSVINKFLIHHKTGKTIPKELVVKIKNASKFNQGFKTTEYLASAIIDLKIHQANVNQINISRFESKTLDSISMPSELVMRHRTPHFSHVFSGEGYATGYYGYIWAEVLTSDAAELFKSSKNGFYNKELSDKLVKYLFAPHNSIKPEEAYLLFKGDNPNIHALMRERGFQ